MSTYMPKAADISRNWYVLDADGKTLGSVARRSYASSRQAQADICSSR